MIAGHQRHRRLFVLTICILITSLALAGCSRSPAEIPVPVTPGTGTLPAASTSDKSVSTTLQERNDLPKTQLQTKQSRELEDNRIGTHWSGMWSISQWFVPLLNGEIRNVGLKRVRLAINDFDWDRVDWSKPEFSIDPSHDNFITNIANNDIIITYVLTFWDKETRAIGEEVDYPRFKTEDQIQRYLDFVRFIVRHFKDRIQYFEIWNEPTIRDSVQWIEVEDYINLVRRAVPVIRQEYPEAKIVVGGTEYLIFLNPATTRLASSGQT